MSHKLALLCGSNGKNGVIIHKSSFKRLKRKKMEKHSVTKDISITVDVEDLLEELYVNELREVLVSQFEDLEDKDKDSVISDCYDLLDEYKQKEFIQDRFFYKDDNDQQSMLESMFGGMARYSQQLVLEQIVDGLDDSQKQELHKYLMEG